MKKAFYLIGSILIIGMASSCSKSCVKCQAVDSRGVLVNTSNTICEHDFNRKHFEDRYKSQFEGYVVTCSSAN
jgi:hypothetical protein